MPQLTLVLKSQKATNSQLISAQELRDKFLYGISIQKDGKEMSDDVFNYWIDFAKAQIEHFLSIKLDLQIIKENKDFHYDDWKSWSMIKTTYPIVCPVALGGFVGSTKQVGYPAEWLSVRRTSDNELYSRLMHVVPTANISIQQSAAYYTGSFTNAGWMGAGRNTPEYWTIEYITGFIKVPTDIQTAIGMLAAINILAVANETLAAAMGMLGGSSKSISLDGLSQSNSLYVNGSTGIFGARIKQYSDQLLGQRGDMSEGLIKRLQDYYGAIIWTTL